VTDLAVLLIHVDGEQLPALTDCPYPVIASPPGRRAAWTNIKKQLRASSAARVLLLFSNETTDFATSGWSGCYSQPEIYARLFSSSRLLAAPSLLTALIPLLPPKPLPGFTVQAREIRWQEPGYHLEQLLYALTTKHLAEAEKLLAGFDYGAADSLVRSRLHAAANLPDAAYATTRRALDDIDGLSEPPAKRTGTNYQRAQLLLAHGLHAAQVGQDGEAALAFNRSYLHSPSIEPLLAWADERLKLGYSGAEVLTPIEQALSATPAREERMIRLLHGIGLDQEVVQRFDTAPLPGDLMAQIHFDCLLRSGQKDAAYAWFQTQGESYTVRYSTDRLVCEWCQATDDLTRNSLAAAVEAADLEVLQDRLVGLRLYAEAEALQRFVADPMSLGHRLFTHGYVMRAAAFYLSAMSNNTLDRAGYQRLAEILLYRGADEQAAEMLEYLLRETPEDSRLRSTLALACLRQSRKLLEESMRLFPSSVFLREEADKTAIALKRLADSGAITVWQLRERGNFHA
jgi:hypothetical protein